jgi:hypothetical protein
MNELKGTNATLEQIKNWSYMNRIPPCGLEEGMELEDGQFPEILHKVRESVCEKIQADCYKCLDVFFEEEIKQ